VTLSEGAALFDASAPPAAWLLLSGEVELARADGVRIRARGGDVIGSFSALSGKEIGLAASVTRAGAALRIAADDLFELLGERPDLLRQLFAGLARSAQTVAR
jgi:CRP-like cAMP-binding protein